MCSLNFCTVLLFVSSITTVQIVMCNLAQGEIAITKMPSDLVKWVNVDSSSEAIFMQLEPAGLEHRYGVTFVKVYICRAQVVDQPHHKPGKLWVNNGAILCSIGVNGTAIGEPNMELLEAPRGSTSWIPLASNETVPNNAITGGTLPDGDTSYVCRTWDDSTYGHLLPGYYSELTRKCYVTTGVYEHSFSENVEILVFNGYGKALELQLKKSG